VLSAYLYSVSSSLENALVWVLVPPLQCDEQVSHLRLSASALRVSASPSASHKYRADHSPIGAVLRVWPAAGHGPRGCTVSLVGPRCRPAGPRRLLAFFPISDCFFIIFLPISTGNVPYHLTHTFSLFLSDDCQAR
jgi:hypothetical protein